MKTLLLLRHAKSSWDNPGGRDFDRPLAPRGRRTAPLIGGHLRDRQLLPDLVLCSTARRARETYDLVVPAVGGTAIQFEQALYLAAPATLLRLVHAAPPGVERLLVIGHNPGLQQFAALLAGTGDAADRDRLQAKFPTAGLAILTFPATSWKEIAPGSGHLESFVAPRDLA
jgi:phosphohistidine phosphatase